MHAPDIVLFRSAGEEEMAGILRKHNADLKDDKLFSDNVAGNNARYYWKKKNFFFFNYQITFPWFLILSRVFINGLRIQVYIYKIVLFGSVLKSTVGYESVWTYRLNILGKFNFIATFIHLKCAQGIFVNIW